MAGRKLEKLQGIGHFAFQLVELLSIENLLILSNKFLSIRLENRRLRSHLFIHIDQHSGQQLGNFILNSLCILSNTTHLVFDLVEVPADQLFFQLEGYVVAHGFFLGVVVGFFDGDQFVVALPTGI